MKNTKQIKVRKKVGAIKKSGLKQHKNEKSRNNRNKTRNEVISSDEDYSFDAPVGSVDENVESDMEDAQQIAFKKAKHLLSRLEGDLNDKSAVERDEIISERLRQEESIIVQKRLADKLNLGDSAVQYSVHRFSTVAALLSNDERYIVSCSKDSSIVKYDLEMGKRVETIKLTKKANGARSVHIFTIALSSDDRFLVSGGSDMIIRIWEFSKMKHIKDLQAHKAPITGLTFRIGTHQLFSCSMDRSVKSWDLGQMGYVDTMYGHVDTIVGIDALYKERLLTCGGQDRSVRLWKIDDDSHLVFNGFETSMSIDCVAFINDNHFVSGSADGSLCIWSVFRKKPVCVRKLAHGKNDLQQPNWIVSVAAGKFTDLIASGSCDGFVRFWKISIDYKSLTNIFSFKLAGFINSLHFSMECDELVCAVGQEHKLGRWWKIKEAKNRITLISLTDKSSNSVSDKSINNLCDSA